MSETAQDDAVLAAVAEATRLGWALAANRAEPPFAGAGALMADFAALADRWMTEDAAAADLSGLRTPGRVRAVIALRLTRLLPFREPLRRAAGLRLLPHIAPWSARAMAATVDAVWHAAGEPLDDATRHTKRATLAAVLTATMLVWLRADMAATLAFLDRRLADVGRIGKIRARAGNMIARKSSRA